MSPPYISWLRHGAADLAPPGVFSDAKAHLFGFDADKHAMQALVDTLLNPAGFNPAGGQVVRYEVPLGVSMVSFMDIARCTSGTEVVGWLPGRECAIWIPLIEHHQNDVLKTRIVLWAPYIFINYAIGMITGREIWGWPKVLADIAVPGDDPGTSQFSCATTFFPTLSAETRGVNDTLLRVVKTRDVVEPAPIWRTGAEAAEAVIGAFLGGVAALLVDVLRMRPHAPSVALKQFRAPGAADVACYQAITDSPIEITAFHGGGPLLDGYALEITTCASHQIVLDLIGRTPDEGMTRLPVTFAGWVNMDFQALSGDTIVAGT